MAQSSPTVRSSANPVKGIVSALTSETSLYILKRVLQAILTLFLASALSFFVIQLAPGDFLDQYRQSPQFSAETLQQLEEQFGLNLPPGGSI